jgi:UPF0755 protein
MAKRKSPAKKQKSNPRYIKVLVALAIVLGLVLAGSAYFYYSRAFRSNLVLSHGEKYVYIRTGSTLEDVMRELGRKGMLHNAESFRWMAELMHYDEQIKPGRYSVRPGMNNRELIALLRSGEQEPVELVFKSIKNRFELARKVSKFIEADSSEILETISSSEFREKYGLNPENALSLIFPDKYLFYWNTPAKAFVDSMGVNYLNFWNSARKEKAAQLGLSAAQVSVLASIIQQESNRKDEWPVIAGVYLNRLKKNMKLQADPTVKFAVGDDGIRRIKRNHLKVNSPYNTYQNFGLPPGPIALAKKESIDAVLNYQTHSYLYFCARPDRSGYHDFANTYTEHTRNASRYRKSLDARGIF